MSGLKDITQKVSRVQVVGPLGVGPMESFTDGHRFYFADDDTARLAAHLTGTKDLAGRTVRISRTKKGWEEKRGKKPAQRLRERLVEGTTVYRLDEEWLFTAAPNTSAIDQ